MSEEYGIIPPSGKYGEDWPANHVIPQGKGGSISSAGWTDGNEGFIQQTFLGASITNFTVSAGFGDTSSTLSVQLVDDEYNKSDGFGYGYGDDVYHTGQGDSFKPPVVGTPVFFKFGKNFATVGQAYLKTIDDLTGYNTVPASQSYPTYTVTGDITEVPTDHYKISTTTSNGVDTHTFENRSVLSDPNYSFRGKDHFVFGGVLQSWTQNKSATGGQLYNLQVTDPREILSNAIVLLNNYQGTTFNNKNLFNAYGFLEYDPSDELLEELEGSAILQSKSVLTKYVNVSGVVYYDGDDLYTYETQVFAVGNYPPSFPITGQGFSRRGDQGIPWYRVSQSLTALMNYDGALPQEYIDAGFGGSIDFRGYRYVVDFSGIPLDLIPQMYFLDFDQIDMLGLAQELCDVISHDLFVSLLPVIDHPSNTWLYNYNQTQIQAGNNTSIIAGIIRIDAIDRSTQPKYGAIKSYIDALTSNGIEVTNQDIGFELSNITTDKFVVGAQEVEMYFFNNNRDRNNLQLRRFKEGLANDYDAVEEGQWDLETSLKQQILPFYGFLGNGAVTIPRGFGSFQQIMLDSSTLNAYGVGNYYVATELELRVAMRSYEEWAHFLSNYDELYMEDITEYNKSFYKGFSQSDVDYGDLKKLDKTSSEFTEIQNKINDAIDAVENASYGVSVPRCVFNSDKDYMGSDGYPASPCAPPYGYPLYYKRGEKIGVAKAGSAGFYGEAVQVITNHENLVNQLKKDASNDGLHLNDDSIVEEIQRLIALASYNWAALPPSIKKKYGTSYEEAKAFAAEYSELVETIVKTKKVKDTIMLKGMKSLALKGVKNAKKVHAFVKGIAEKHLGKTFLVKIPRYCNLTYANDIVVGSGGEFTNGPFGFKPVPINSETGYAESQSFQLSMSTLQAQNLQDNRELYTHYVDRDSSGKYSNGALKGNFNPVSEKWDFNYEPVPDGGFFNFQVYDRQISFTDVKNLKQSKLPSVIKQMLAPRDVTSIMNDNTRIKCYARYDNSQILDLSSIGKDSVVQEKVTAQGNIPDVLEEIDNTGGEKFNLDRVQEFNTSKRMDKAVAYVTCELDSKLYMAPKTTTSSVKVFGRKVKFVPASPELTWDFSDDNNDCPDLKPDIKNFYKIFSPADDGGSDGKKANNGDFVRYYDSFTDSNVVDTERENLDPEHVYALITVPGRIKPTTEVRYLDAQAYEVGADQIKHNMTQDVVRGPAGFEKPTPVNFSPITLFPFTLTCADLPKYSLNVVDGLKAQRDAIYESSKFGNYDKRQAFYQPSPVFPDLVAIPLMSKERCYGPWLSASTLDVSANPRIKYSDIGGRVEFVKDENLAPWNFAGYQLMNEAGKLQAQFSNSLLLFSERGGFVIPEAPTGIALATALSNGGPLVTNITVDVSDAGFKTTVKMDLYTSSFGKLQKQKQDAIAKISRERQKIIDQNNSMVRKGFGKNMGKADFLAPLRNVAGAYKETNEDIARSNALNKIRFKATGEGVSSNMTTEEEAQNDNNNLASVQQDQTKDFDLGLIIQPFTAGFDGFATMDGFGGASEATTRLDESTTEQNEEFK